MKWLELCAGILRKEEHCKQVPFLFKLLEGKLQRRDTEEKSDVTIGTFYVTTGTGYLTVCMLSEVIKGGFLLS